MQTQRNGVSRLFALFAIVLPIAAAAAADQAGVTSWHWSAGGAACHPLMLAPECDRYRTTMATMPPGKEKERYVQLLREWMADREAACSCHRVRNAAIVTPTRRQGGSLGS